MRRTLGGLVLLASLVYGAGGATAHEMDHPAPAFTPPDAPLSTSANAGGEGAAWRLHTTIVTGNPHTDVDFFRSGGELFLSAGTLGTGPNAGGQTIVRLTEEGELAPDFVASHGSASCLSNPGSALGLQHDVEATPKGDVLLNTDWGKAADRREAQLLLDATDAGGRCHDQGALGVAGNPRGGLEIIDITDPADPVEIGMTRHIGEAHTVNVDPSRPHIAYVSGSDRVGIDAEGNRTNERTDGQPFNLDGFEVVDLSSCMDFPEGTSVEAKRDACRPQVYRVRFELGWTRGTYANGFQAGCHELEVHPNDVLTCAAADGTVALDMSGAFDGTGRPKGKPLPCRVTESASAAPFATAAPVTDCVSGADEADLRVPGWLAMGAPSLRGVELVGFVNHGGRELSNNAVSHTPDEDVSVSHEAELTHSGRFLIVSDERGGGVVPPDASCPTPMAQPLRGNGGMHAYEVGKLFTEYPAVAGEDGKIDGAATAEAARAAYARTPDDEAAIVRITPRVPGEIECTAHVFHQVPGQNRIFMGWYSQGTQVLDYVEHADGTFEWFETAYFVPESANSWVSDVFHSVDNGDGTFTYWGASADFALGGRGRNSIDIYTVTLPAPRQMADGSTPAACDEGGPGSRKGCERAAANRDQNRPGRDGADEVGAASAAPQAAETVVIDLREATIADQRAVADRPAVSPLALATALALLSIGAVVVVPRRVRARAGRRST